MNIKILTSAVFDTNIWAGGTTTELFIYPENKNFQKRDFHFRLSKAQVVDKESVFTSLPSINRKLMVLDGEITLLHEGHHSKKLAKLDSDNFDGGWSTSSKGTCSNFNLMTKGKTKGNLIGFEILDGKSISYNIKTEHEFGFIYNFKGQTDVRINEELYPLEENSLMVIKNLNPLHLGLLSNENSTLVLVTISNH